MMDFLYQLDVSIFFFINHTISNPVFDKFFPFITEVKNWYIAYIVLISLLFFKGGRVGKISVLILLLMIAATDQLSSNLIKNLVSRIRPCNVLENVNILATCTESFSFPSSHAVNNFAVAIFFITIFKRYSILLITIAGIIALSRVYVGVHYPSDIIGGAIIGSIMGYIFGLLVTKLEEYIIIKSRKITGEIN